VHLLVLMTFLFLCASSDSYSMFHHPCVQAIILQSTTKMWHQQTWQDVILCVRISNESRKIGFLMRLMSLTSIISIMLLMNFVEPSQSHLCSDPRQEHGMAL
jgi:hypothetical protein